MKEVGLFGVINSLVHCNLKLAYLIFSIHLIFSKLIEVSYTTTTVAKKLGTLFVTKFNHKSY